MTTPTPSPSEMQLSVDHKIFSMARRLPQGEGGEMSKEPFTPKPVTMWIVFRKNAMMLGSLSHSRERAEERRIHAVHLAVDVCKQGKDEDWRVLPIEIRVPKEAWTNDD